VDNRWDCLEDVRHFLEWQKMCGTDVWMVENDQAWNPARFVSQLPKAQFKKPESSTPQKQAKEMEPLRRKVVEETARIEEKPVESLGGGWGKVIKDRTPKIDFTILDEQSGIKRIQAHQRKYCEEQKPCALGGGRPKNPVLILEGHPDGLSDQGKKVLSIIRADVLKLAQNQIYWLPYPMKVGCGLCSNLFAAALECISPKVVLVMGEGLRHRLPMSASERSLSPNIEIGAEIQLVTNKWTIPGIWTQHPNDLAIASIEKKQEGMKHFSQFARLMRQKGV
jgi:hypothetical protein